MGKKIKTLARTGLSSLIEGLHNFNNENPIIEDLAKIRASICVECPLMIIEPVKQLRVQDIRIPEISEMMCDDCGCELPLKTRQSIDVCKNWLIS